MENGRGNCLRAPGVQCATVAAHPENNLFSFFIFFYSANFFKCSSASSCWDGNREKKKRKGENNRQTCVARLVYFEYANDRASV